jgi:hypothetical protein
MTYAREMRLGERGVKFVLGDRLDLYRFRIVLFHLKGIRFRASH